MCIAQYGCFCNSFITCFPGMLLMHCLNDFELPPPPPSSSSIAFMQDIYSYKTVVPEVCSTHPRGSMTSFQGIHAYISQMATLKFAYFLN